MTLTFVTYTATSNSDLTKQAILDVDTETFALGRHSLTVTIPNRYYQIDFVRGGPTGKVTPPQLLRYADSNAGNSDAWSQYRLACVLDSVNGRDSG